jgi:hypothetical protein
LVTKKTLGRRAAPGRVAPATTVARRNAVKAPAKARGPSEDQAVLAAAKKLATAIRRGDKGAAEKLLAPEFTFIDASGAAHARRDVLANLKAGPDNGGSRVKVRTYGRRPRHRRRQVGAGAATQRSLFGRLWVKGNDGWKALIHHNNVLARPDASLVHPAAPARPADAKPPECKNPLKSVPYQPRSQAERDVITAFQTMETAVTHNDAEEWAKHVAAEFTVYRTHQHPTTKAARIGFIEAQRQINAQTFVAEIKWMKLWVLGDAAVMRADHIMPGNRRPPYRATRIWIKRDGRWQMAVSQQTTITA